MTVERVVSETGGQKDRKPSEIGWVDPIALLELGEVAGFGDRKYGNGHNFLQGYDWSLAYNAMMRHLMLFWSGEDVDPESGKLHITHAAWHALALTSFAKRGIGKDNRPPQF